MNQMLYYYSCTKKHRQKKILRVVTEEDNLDLKRGIQFLWKMTKLLIYDLS